MLICYDRVTGGGCGTENRNDAKHCQKCGMSLRYALELHDSGTVIGSYRIVNVIGSGGFGAVYEAVHTSTAQHVALKQTFDPRNIRTFQSEFVVLHNLKNHHLPRYYETFEAHGNGYLVIELIPGQSLGEVLGNQQHRPLVEAQVMGYAIQMCDVLTYLHGQNPQLTHRDIKPDNIRLTGDGLIKLVDFGLLKQGTDTTRLSRKALTPAYAPLEQWGGTGEHTNSQSDIYSLGATFYHLLTGRPPMEVPDRIKMTNDPLPPPRQLNPAVSEHVSDALMKALAIYPEYRFENAEAFKYALMRFAPTQATPPSQPKNGQAKSSVKGWLIAAAVVLVILGAVATAMVSSQQEGQAAQETATAQAIQETLVVQQETATAQATQETLSSASAYVDRGNSYREQEKYDEAIADYTTAIEIDPDYAWAYNNRGVAYDNQGKYDLAIADYTTAIELDPDHKEAYYNRGNAYRKQGKYDLAIADYTKAIEIDPDYKEAYTNRGNAYYNQGKYDLAIADYTTAIELDPDYAWTYYNRGNAYDNQGKYDLAIADYTTAIELDPDHKEAYNNRGVAYDNQGKYDLAIADYTTAIELDPDDAGAYYNRGLAYEQGKYDLAIADYTTAIELDPDHKEAYYNRGNAYYNQGKYDLAIADYTTAIELDPDHKEAYYNRGNAYYNQGKYDLAIADYTTAIELDPDYAWAYNNRGVAYDDQGKYDLAIADYTTAIELDPDFAWAYTNRGVAYKKQGKYDLAIADYTKVIELDPDDAGAYYNRANAYEALGQHDLAAQDRAKAAELE